VFFARKHTAWYLGNLAEAGDLKINAQELDSLVLSFRKEFNSLEDCSAQLDTLESIFELLKSSEIKQQLKKNRQFRELAA